MMSRRLMMASGAAAFVAPGLFSSGPASTLLRDPRGQLPRERVRLQLPALRSWRFPALGRRIAPLAGVRPRVEPLASRWPDVAVGLWAEAPGPIAMVLYGPGPGLYAAGQGRADAGHGDHGPSRRGGADYPPAGALHHRTQRRDAARYHELRADRGIDPLACARGRWTAAAARYARHAAESAAILPELSRREDHRRQPRNAVRMGHRQCAPPVPCVRSGPAL